MNNKIDNIATIKIRNKKYILYNDETKTKVKAGFFYTNDFKTFHTIEDEKEWELIQNILNAIRNQKYITLGTIKHKGKETTIIFDQIAQEKRYLVINGENIEILDKTESKEIDKHFSHPSEWTDLTKGELSKQKPFTTNRNPKIKLFLKGLSMFFTIVLVSGSLGTIQQALLSKENPTPDEIESIVAAMAEDITYDTGSFSIIEETTIPETISVETEAIEPLVQPEVNINNEIETSSPEVEGAVVNPNLDERTKTLLNAVQANKNLDDIEKKLITRCSTLFFQENNSFMNIEKEAEVISTVKIIYAKDKQADYGRSPNCLAAYRYSDNTIVIFEADSSKSYNFIGIDNGYISIKHELLIHALGSLSNFSYGTSMDEGVASAIIQEYLGVNIEGSYYNTNQTYVKLLAELIGGDIFKEALFKSDINIILNKLYSIDDQNDPESILRPDNLLMRLDYLCSVDNKNLVLGSEEYINVVDFRKTVYEIISHYYTMAKGKDMKNDQIFCMYLDSLYGSQNADYSDYLEAKSFEFLRIEKGYFSETYKAKHPDLEVKILYRVPVSEEKKQEILDAYETAGIKKANLIVTEPKYVNFTITENERYIENGVEKAK